MLAPDLIGFGDSDKVLGPEYRVADHPSYLDAFFDAVPPTEKVTLVINDWGSALSLDWARRHEERIVGIAFFEFVCSLHQAGMYFHRLSHTIFDRFEIPNLDGSCSSTRMLLLKRSCQ